MPLRFLFLILLVLGVLWPAAPANGSVLIGLGDQQPSTFEQPRFRWLGLTTARLVVSWDVQNIPWERRRADDWLANARAAGVEPVVAFGGSWSTARKPVLPSVAAYRAAFDRFRAAHPLVRAYVPWNEANHPKQPTFRHPRAAAAYFDAARASCRGCKLVAGDVLDTPGMTRWVRHYQAALETSPSIWGMHNYRDASRRRSTATRQLLRITDGELWLTETGGVVRRPRGRTGVPRTRLLADAGMATRYVLRLATSQLRISRVYLYQWSANETATWDSALVESDGALRPAFIALAEFLGLNWRKVPPARADAG